jgi:hypothetical protein
VGRGGGSVLIGNLVLMREISKGMRMKEGELVGVDADSKCGLQIC